MNHTGKAAGGGAGAMPGWWPMVEAALRALGAEVEAGAGDTGWVAVRAPAPLASQLTGRPVASGRPHRWWVTPDVAWAARAPGIHPVAPGTGMGMRLVEAARDRGAFGVLVETGAAARGWRRGLWFRFGLTVHLPEAAGAPDGPQRPPATELIDILADPTDEAVWEVVANSPDAPDLCPLASAVGALGWSSAYEVRRLAERALERATAAARERLHQVATTRVEPAMAQETDRLRAYFAALREEAMAPTRAIYRRAAAAQVLGELSRDPQWVQRFSGRAAELIERARRQEEELVTTLARLQEAEARALSELAASWEARGRLELVGMAVVWLAMPSGDHARETEEEARG